MTLTYGGNLGIGITNPSNKLQVSGSVQVSSLNVTGNVFATGAGSSVTVNDIYLLNGQNSVLDANGSSLFDLPLNFTSGISTFFNLDITNNLYLSSISRIGIGSTIPISSIDAQNSTVLFGSVGVGTDSVENNDVEVYGTVGIFDGDLTVGVNTSTGVILTSPNGTQYRLVVANDGNLSTAPV